MPEYSARESLRQAVGHFRGGEFTTSDGKLMMRFHVDFVVTEDALWMLNRLTAGVQLCQKVLASNLSPKIILVQFVPGVRQNAAIGAAILYRTRVNQHLDRTNATLLRPVSSNARNRSQEHRPTRRR